jgi:hypothetical protein
VGLEQEPVVLVRAEGLLEAAFAAEREPAPADPLQVVALAHDLDGALADAVVQHRDEERQLLRPHALLDQRARQRAHLAGEAGKDLAAGGEADLHRELAQAEPLQREKITLRHHAGKPPLLGHEHVADALRDHGDRGLVGERVPRQRERVGRHGLDDAMRRRVLRKRGDDVLVGHDADRARGGVDHHQRADALGAHLGGRLGHGDGGRAGQRRALHQRAQRPGEGLLLLGDSLLKARGRLRHR